MVASSFRSCCLDFQREKYRPRRYTSQYPVARAETLAVGDSANVSAYRITFPLEYQHVFTTRSFAGSLK